MRNRRSYLKGIGILSSAGLAGCSGTNEPSRNTTSEPSTETTSTDSSDQATETDSPPAPLRPAGDSAWPMHRHDSTLTGFTPEYGPVSNLSVDWTWPDSTNTFDPIFDDSQFYVTTNAVRAASYDGETQWENKISGRKPVLVGDTLVMSHNKRMYGWNKKTGNREWFTDPILRGYTGPLQARNGLVYATVKLDNGVGVTAFDSKSGEKKWSVSHDGLSARYPLLPAITSDRLYLPYGQSVIQVHDTASGDHVDTLDVGGSIHDVVIPNQNIGDKDTIYALSKDRRGENFVQAIDPNTAETLWKQEMAFKTTRVAPLPTMTLDPESVYVTAETGIVSLNRTTGEQRWKSEVKRGITEPIVSAGNAIYVATTDRKLRVFDYRTGDELAMQKFDEPISGLAVKDNQVFVSANRIYAIRGDTSV